MPFKYKRKTDRGKIDPQKFLEVAKLVLDREISLCSASSTFDLPKTTLGRYVARLKKDVTMCPSYQNSMIFSINEEMALCEYVIKSSKMHYGLNTTCVKQLAFSYATALGKNIPKNWSDNKAASSDWLRGFLGRNHNILSIRTPEATSLSRSTSFNKHNISMFFENLKICYQKRKFEAHRIFNVDETGVTTVQKPKKVVTQKGLKQVGQVTSAERGTLITVCFAVNAIGHVIPPFFIFPRVNYKDYMLKNAPIGSTGVAHPSGWMNENLFINFFDHFLKFTKPDENDPILLIMDNHFSHISINLINKARDNHVTLLTLPPHCSNRMQPLDISVFGPFKSYYNTAADGWLLNHPGKTITIYDIPELVAEAVPKGFTISNITSGFAKSGIYPFNPEVFNEEDFLCSSVTDRPTPPPLIATSPASTSKSYELQPEITPEAIRPFPAALPRKTSNRRKGSTKILTSTPEKNLIEQQQQRQQNNKATRRPPAKKNKMVKKKLFMNNKTAEPAKMTSENEKEKADEEMGTNSEVHVPLTFLSLHAIFVKIIFTNRVLTTMRMGMVMKQ